MVTDMKYLHTMVRVTDLDQSLRFYCDALGLREIRRYDSEQGRFTLVFLAAPGDEDAQVELTYNWDPEELAGGRNFGHLAYRVPDIYDTCQRLMDAGVTVGIGTDGAASNNLLDVLAEVRLAALLAKVAGGGGTVAAEQALRMATIDAARALRRDHETGSVEPGKLADLTCIDLHRCNSQPVYEPVSQLVYATRADQVSDVWVAGRHLLDQGELTSINRESIFKRSSEWRQRIANSRK